MKKTEYRMDIFSDSISMYHENNDDSDAIYYIYTVYYGHCRLGLFDPMIHYDILSSGAHEGYADWRIVQ